MKKPFNIFFAINRGYLQHFTVAVTSLLENNKDIDIAVFVIHDEKDIAVFDVTTKFIQEKYGITINYLDIGNVDFSIFRTTSFYNKYTYFRLFIAEISPPDMETCLFLDSDLVVAGSIKELTEIDMSNQSIAAVSEASVDDNVLRLNELGSPAKSYFSAGVMLINLKAWRANKVLDDFISIANTHTDKLEWVDQDILNICFANNWKMLNRKYNAVHLLEKLPETPVIVHYASYSKPWFYVDTHPYNYLYWKYLRMTPFKDAKSIGFSLKNLIFKNGKLFKRKLRYMGILKFVDQK